MSSSNSYTLHDNNTSLVMRVIRDYAPISRTDICEHTGLAASTVSVITGELQEQNLIRECGHASSTGGRRPVLLEVNPNGGYFIGADLGNTQMTVGVLNLSLQVVQVWSYSPAQEGGEVLYKQLVDALWEAHGWCGKRSLKVLGIGIAAPGLIDSSVGLVIEADNLGWFNFELQANLQREFDYPVLVENDTSAAAYGEYRYGVGSEGNVKNMFYISIGTGIGSGLILNGELYTGSQGMAGEIGHVVADLHGEICSCGKIGCLESVSSEPAIVKAYNKVTPSPNREANWVIDQANQGDALALQILGEAGRAIGVAIGNQVNVLNLETIVLGRSLMTANEIILSGINQGLTRAVLPKFSNYLQLKLGSLGYEAGITGVASLSLAGLFRM